MDLRMYKSFSVVPICVTKVASSFENFRFAVWLNPLNISSVEAEIVHTLWSALTFKADYYPIFSFWVHAVFRWWSSKSSSQFAPTLHSTHGLYKGEMYKMESGWTTSQTECDWKQLGLLAAKIILGTCDHVTIVKHSPRVDQDECLRNLIKQG